MHRLKIISLAFFMVFLVSVIGFTEPIGEEVTRPLAKQEEQEIRNNLLNAGLLGFSIDLNVEISIPEQNDFPAVNLWGTLIKLKKEEKTPTILIATPYRRELFSVLGVPFLFHGYNVLILDIRGTGSSGGQWPSFDLMEHYDLKYVIDEWIPSQDWSDGKIGMVGPSYMAIIQLMAAGLIDRDTETGEPLHLKALFPLASMSDSYRDIIAHGGNVDIEFIPMWLFGVDLIAALPPILFLGDDFVPTIDDIEEATTMWINHITQIPKHFAWIMDYNHSKDGSFYDNKSPMIYWPVKPENGWGFYEGDNCRIPEKLPVFLTGGWFDLFTRGTLNNYQYGLSEHSDSDKALIVGEWYHLGASIGLGIPSLEMQELPARWFDWKIKGKDDAFMEDFPVLLYVMGEKRWRAEKSWPLPESRTEERTYYLSKMESSLIEGDWFTNKDSNQIYSLVENVNVIDFEGDNPVLKHSALPLALHGATSRSSTRWLAGILALPSQVSKFLLGNDINHLMPFEDERSDEWKILTFTTEPLEKNLEIIGPMHVTFWAKTEFTNPLSKFWINNTVRMIKNFLYLETNLILDLMNKEDVQWIVELNDVFPNGRARNITSGWLSAWHRQYDPNEAADALEHPIDPDYTPYDPFYDEPDKNPKPINEGELYQYVVELWPTCNVFMEGHRIRLTITGSDFPHLLPVLIPSTNTIVIDDLHPATLDFTVTNQDGQGDTWKWVDGVNNYLMPPKEEPANFITDEEITDELAKKVSLEEAPIGIGAPSDSGGCGFIANASADNDSSATKYNGILFNTFILMLFTFIIILLQRTIRRRSRKNSSIYKL